MMYYAPVIIFLICYFAYLAWSDWLEYKSNRDCQEECCREK